MNDSLQNKSLLNRRQFIRLSAGITLIPLLGFGSASCQLNSSPVINNWRDLSGSGDGQGSLVIEKLEGEATVNGVALKKGMGVPSGSAIELASGIVLASLPDQSIIKLSHRASLTVDLDSKKGGLLHLKKGGLLAVVRKSTLKPYLLRNASAVVGIKGTVFYSQVISEADKEDPNIPATASDYFCICNGNIDFLDEGFEKLKSDAAVHHNAYFLNPGQDHLSIDMAGYLLNHSDQEIYEVIKQMRGEKHKTNWLFGKKNMYSAY